MTTPTATAAQTAAAAAAAADPPTSIFADPFVQTVNGYLQNTVSSGIFNPQSFISLSRAATTTSPVRTQTSWPPLPAIRPFQQPHRSRGRGRGSQCRCHCTRRSDQCSGDFCHRFSGQGNVRRQPCGPAFGGASPIQLAAAEAPLVATTAEGAPLIPCSSRRCHREHVRPSGISRQRKAMDRPSPAPSCGDLRQADETKAHAHHAPTQSATPRSTSPVRSPQKFRAEYSL